MDQFLASILLFAGNFAMTGYAFCAGQTLSISQNTALFTLLGTTYGGNGVQNFQLPNLQGRVPVGYDGGNSYYLGQTGGAASVTITQNNLPAHTHAFALSNAAGTTGIPGTTTYLSKAPSTGSGPNAVVQNFYTTTAPDTTLGPLAVGLTGGNSPVNIIPPYLVISYVIALQGIFPSRN